MRMSRRQETAHKRPRPKMALMAIFFPTGICSLHRTGIGKSTREKSIIRLTIPIARYASVLLPQTPPGISLFHVNSKGRQRRNDSKITAIIRATVSAMTIKTAMRILGMVKMLM